MCFTGKSSPTSDLMRGMCTFSKWSLKAAGVMESMRPKRSITLVGIAAGSGICFEID